MKKIFTLFFILALVSLFLTGCVVKECPECEDCETCEECLEIEEKALLDASIYDWAINIYDEDELFFNYWVYNYGYEEAKNVVVKCNVYNTAEELIKSATDNIGNVASTSAVFEEMVTERSPMSLNREYSVLCYVISCENCEILHKRIPDLREQLI